MAPGGGDTPPTEQSSRAKTVRYKCAPRSVLKLAVRYAAAMLQQLLRLL